MATVLCIFKISFTFSLLPTVADIYWRWPIFAIYLILILTDIADGQVARSKKFKGGVTNLGKKLDPLADKVLIITGYWAWTLCFSNWLFPLAALITLREILVTYIRYCAEQKDGEVIAARWSGKIKMACQSITLLWLITPFGNVDNPITIILVLVTSGVTLWSGIEYWVKFSKYIVK